MNPSVTLCREEGDRQRAIAEGSTLENVRARALAAAAAWDKEGVLALRRESKAAATTAAKIEGTAHSPTAEERTLSENPDRGFSDSDGDLDKEPDTDSFDLD